MSEGAGQPQTANVLALCGSLRPASINAALLRAAARLAPREIRVQLAGLERLPLFNPDLESAPPR
jgi:NAD(P)H-dependent FMN reductase